MKPRIKLATAEAPDGTPIDLYEHDGDHEISIQGAGLMSSRQSHSEEELARIGLAELEIPRPLVLIGGLGLGFTLRAALAVLPDDARVLQAELVPEIVEWNRTLIGHHAGGPLEDPRVEVVIGDVARVAAKRRGKLAAILLDIDNGASPMVTGGNRKLYSPAGMRTLRRALLPGGHLAIWSANEDPRLEGRMRDAGFIVESHEAHARPGRKGARHVIVVGRATAGMGRPAGGGSPAGARRGPRRRARG